VLSDETQKWSWLVERLPDCISQGKVGPHICECEDSYRRYPLDILTLYPLLGAYICECEDSYRRIGQKSHVILEAFSSYGDSRLSAWRQGSE
jgi:hypothetical protein